MRALAPRWSTIGLVAMLVAALALERCTARRAGAAEAGIAARDSVIAQLHATIREGDARLDSALAAARPDSTHLAAIAPRIRITSPRMIAVDTSGRHPIAQGARPPPLMVSVPPELTDLVEAQARRIRQLEGLLAIAQAGITSRAQLLTTQATQIDVLAGQRPHWYDRIGIVASYGVTATPGGQLVHGVQIGVGLKVWP